MSMEGHTKSINGSTSKMIGLTRSMTKMMRLLIGSEEEVNDWIDEVNVVD